eukprot:CAMPEP_0113315340 /NCGR_PEP_ID=MMETSP0010_2-20120614/11049_1 /TAXON_ID=216773 ORGANISM="Corethron hystrix, Strain 308" /NCGR_SAMPLE_ID=MMETSP0010_2 /ASSEMBLY_ACC=CAM_ASM_000155 /LENGTH=147 /DNA_ID=CAMNT_0000171825 /DNA_START=150 /DNA_END=590 /DNA_ORIENTATION=- /assembly_acc=CAM_ASM_000155
MSAAALPPGSVLTDAQASSLQSSLLASVSAAGIVGGDASDLVEYILIMTRNGRPVREMVAELVEMDLLSREANGVLGSVMEDFLAGIAGEGGAEEPGAGDAAEGEGERAEEEGEKKMVTIGGDRKKTPNALQMSGALGANRLGKTPR